MFLKNLILTNFRNYSTTHFAFNSPITVLIGDNAQGKSNFLEAIYFLSTTKSYRADKDEELVKKGEELLKVEGEIENSKGLVRLEIIVQKVIDFPITKRVKVNKIPRRVVDYIGNLAVVTFSPEDINFVTGSPSLRRWHIDLTLAQIDKEYKKVLTNYEQIVTAKNRILKKIREGESQVDELTFWVDQQLEMGRIITRKREDFFNFLNKTERKFDSFTFDYIKNELTKDKILEYQQKEIASANSLIGPHRDDFRFLSSNGDQTRDLAKFGSRGEQRTAVLDLKIAEVAYIEFVLGSRPILLLDEVFSELDLEHRKHVLSLINMQQTIIATVEFDDYLKERLNKAAIFNVENGKLTEIVDK